MWGGTIQGCHETNWFSQDEVLPKKDWLEKYNRDYNNWCSNVEAIQPKLQDKFYGKYFCGITGGTPFHAV